MRTMKRRAAVGSALIALSLCGEQPSVLRLPLRHRLHLARRARPAVRVDRDSDRVRVCRRQGRVCRRLRDAAPACRSHPADRLRMGVRRSRAVPDPIACLEQAQLPAGAFCRRRLNSALDQREADVAETKLADVMAELAGLEDPKMREVNERHGDDHGVNLSKLRALAKRLKSQQELAQQLWGTGDTAARLAGAADLSAEGLRARRAGQHAARGPCAQGS